MRKCSLCGGKLDYHKRCTFCGLDNTKNDDAYRHLLNRSSCESEPLTHVHDDASIYGDVERKMSGQLDFKTVLGIIVAIITIIVSIFGAFE